MFLKIWRKKIQYPKNIFIMFYISLVFHCTRACKSYFCLILFSLYLLLSLHGFHIYISRLRHYKNLFNSFNLFTSIYVVLLITLFNVFPSFIIFNVEIFHEIVLSLQKCFSFSNFDLKIKTTLIPFEVPISPQIFEALFKRF